MLGEPRRQDGDARRQQAAQRAERAACARDCIPAIAARDWRPAWTSSRVHVSLTAQDAEPAGARPPPRRQRLGLGTRSAGSAAQTLVYGVGGVALQLVGIVTLPIFARVFSPGRLRRPRARRWSAAAILMIVVDGGMASASQRSYFDHCDEQEAQRRRILITALLFQLALGDARRVVVTLFAAPLSRALFDGRDETGVVVLLGAGAARVRRRAVHARGAAPGVPRRGRISRRRWRAPRSPPRSASSPSSRGTAA